MIEKLPCTQADKCIASLDDLTIYTALDHKEQFNTIVDEFEHIELELASVGECDTAGLQLLFALQKHCHTQDKSFTINSLSDELTSMLSNCQLDPAVLGVKA